MRRPHDDGDEPRYFTPAEDALAITGIFAIAVLTVLLAVAIASDPWLFASLFL